MKKEIGIILIGWFLVNALILAKQGIVTTGEAEKYIYQAQFFLDHGHLQSANFTYYSFIIFLLAFCIKFHLGFATAMVLQTLINLAATLCFFHTLQKIFHSRTATLTATILLLLNIPYQAFNTAMQSESLFQSGSLLLSCWLLQKQKLRVQHIAATLLFIFLLSLSRPLGLLYIPAAFLYYYHTTLRQTSLTFRLAFSAAIILAFAYVLNHAMVSGGKYDFMLPFREEHIICGTPTLLQPLEMQTVEKDSGLYALLYYIAHHPGQFLRLALQKTISFWGVYRSYYSHLHNALLLTFFYPLIGMAIASLGFWRRQHPSKLIYLLTLILVTWGTVVLTCDDWSNRIFLSITPYLIILTTGFLFRKGRSINR